ncbi:MAG: hypothetical protein ACI4M9_05860 [Succinivibrio sp.]
MSNTESKAPRRADAGFVFKALLKSALQPLSAAITVPLMLLAPGAAASFILHALRHQSGKYLALKGGFKKCFDLREFFLLEIFYLFTVFLLFKTFIYKAEIYLKEYENKALNHHVLQLGTPEQLEYAHNLGSLFFILGLFLYFALVILLHRYYMQIRYKEDGIIAPPSFKVVLKGVFVNLDYYLVIYLATAVIISMVEGYFARYKLIYLQGWILGEDTFNPAILFIIIRLFILHLTVCTTAIVSLRSSLKN